MLPFPLERSSFLLCCFNHSLSLACLVLSCPSCLLLSSSLSQPSFKPLLFLFSLSLLLLLPLLLYFTPLFSLLLLFHFYSDTAHLLFRRSDCVFLVVFAHHQPHSDILLFLRLLCCYLNSIPLYIDTEEEKKGVRMIERRSSYLVFKETLYIYIEREREGEREARESV